MKLISKFEAWVIDAREENRPEDSKEEAERWRGRMAHIILKFN